MNLQQRLRSKDAQFLIKRKRIFRKDNSIEIEDYGPPIGFQALISYRKPSKPIEMASQLDSAEGFIAANIGVSASINLRFEGFTQEYLLTHTYGQKGGLFLLKLISGYNPLSQSLEQTILEEVKEEILVTDEKDNPQRGSFNARGLNASLPQDNLVINSSDSFGYIVSDGGNLDYLLSLDKRLVSGLNSAHMMFDANCSSAQVIFPLVMGMPLRGNIYHLEDIWNAQFKRLDTILNREGILLLERNGDGFSGKTFFIKDGNLIAGPSPDKLLLYSSFAPKSSFGVVNQKHISFEKYLSLI